MSLATLRGLPPPPPGRTGWPWTVEAPPLPAHLPDGSPWPRISIVTPVYNQDRYLEETIRSVLLQGYPDLEYVVVNDGSTDASETIIHRYATWLAHWETQANRGQAAAINRGFEHTTGPVLAYLNSDDIYLPGALGRVGQEVDPARGRHVVMGRCQFVDPDGRPIGVEHPSRFESHRRVLAVWKGHAIPQPAVFWTREAWQAAGPMTEDDGPQWIDYGLFCRMSRDHAFRPLEQVLATYRLHPESQTMRTSHEARLETCIRISRRHWGPAWSPAHAALACSLAWHRLGRRRRGRAWLAQAADDRRRGRRLRSAGRGAAAALVAPDVVLRAVAERVRRRRRPPALARLIERLLGDRGPRSGSRERTPWPDG